MKIVPILAIIGFILTGCSKDVAELPPATQTGAQTFGAKVDGKFWIPEGFGIVPTAPILEARRMPGNRVLINARNFAAQPTETEFEIYLKNVTGPGVYPLNKTTGIDPQARENYAYYVERRLTPKAEWITNPNYTGKVTLTLMDTVNRILAGTFEFNAQAMDIYENVPPITVTDGRFDIKYQ